MLAPPEAHPPVSPTRLRSTGQPANDFNKPKVDLGPAAFGFDAPRDGACKLEAEADGAERVILKALALVGLPYHPP